MILGVIPARAGSKTILNKNIYPLCGKPLIDWTWDIAVSSKLDAVRITTDDDNIIKKYGHILCYKRNKELCQDDTPMFPVIKDAVEKYENQKKCKVDAVMLLQPTSPLRLVEDINMAISLYVNMNMPNPLDLPYGASCLYSGYYMGIKTDIPYDKHKSSKHFQRNGAIFITSRELINEGKLWDESAIKYEMPLSRSIDIDDMDDMFIVESIIKNRRTP